MAENCGACKFWKKAASVIVGQNKEGECHRYPPSLHLIPAPQGVMAMSKFPITLPEEWCGEFKIKIMPQ